MVKFKNKSSSFLLEGWSKFSNTKTYPISKSIYKNKRKYNRTITYPEELQVIKKKSFSKREKQSFNNEFYDKIIDIQILNTLEKKEYLSNNIIRIKKKVLHDNFDTENEINYFLKRKIIFYNYSFIKFDDEYLYLQKFDYKTFFNLLKNSIYTQNLNYILDLKNYDLNLKNILLKCIKKDYKIIKYYKKIDILIFK